MKLPISSHSGDDPRAKAGIMTDALAWAGTFHGIGARLLRDYAEQIGLDPDFMIHDREDSADLMNLARHELGFSKMESRFPTKGTCLQSTRSMSCRPVSIAESAAKRAARILARIPQLGKNS
jgi:DNA helicase-2/ATP-dependent DNA helicase PcrA